jgi:hypothetical protein
LRKSDSLPSGKNDDLPITSKEARIQKRMEDAIQRVVKSLSRNIRSIQKTLAARPDLFTQHFVLFNDLPSPFPSPNKKKTSSVRTPTSTKSSSFSRQKNKRYNDHHNDHSLLDSWAAALATILLLFVIVPAFVVMVILWFKL